jgi:hypothetical protein
MSTFRELKEFEHNFATMTVSELERWKVYWTSHAERLAPKAHKQAMKRIYDIEKAIKQRQGNEPTPPVGPVSEACPDSRLHTAPTKKAKARAGRIMYIESKAGNLTGPARIGRVRFSQTGRTLYYGDQKFQSLKGGGFKSNFYDVDTGEDYWISGPKRNGGDALYGGNTPVEIDEDVREEYWRDIRRQPHRIGEATS